jgi:formate hydrogenlyase subunit 6/NADH:ubiquinone oxidoreductase subunit I
MTSGFLNDLIRSFLVGLTGKTSTVKSPAEVEVPAAYRGVPIIDPEKCVLPGLSRCERVPLRKACAYSWDIAYFAASAR